MNKFTSEDNASFEELALLHKKKEQIRNAWMYEAERKHNEEFVTRGNELMKAADEQIMISLAPGAAEGILFLYIWISINLYGFSYHSDISKFDLLLIKDNRI